MLSNAQIPHVNELVSYFDSTWTNGQFKRHQWNYFNFERAMHQQPCWRVPFKAEKIGSKPLWDHWCFQEERSERKDENADAGSWSTANRPGDEATRCEDGGGEKSDELISKKFELISGELILQELISWELILRELILRDYNAHIIHSFTVVWCIISELLQYLSGHTIDSKSIRKQSLTRRRRGCFPPNNTAWWSLMAVKEKK